MRHTLVSCLVVIGLIGAVCGAGVSKQAADHVAFPGPSELRADPSLTVLVDSASGDSLLVLGTQLTFSELREKLVPKLEANGWTVTHPVPNPRAQITDDDVIGAQKGGDCIAYWNMNQGAWAAPSMRRDAARRSPAFERQSAAYATVFAVYLIECP